MTEDIPLPESDEAALAAYVDGRLDPAERSALEARLGAEPALAAALAQQRAGLTAITTAARSVSTPLALRSRIEAMERDGAPRSRRRRERRGWDWGRAWLPGAVLAAAAVAAVAVVIAFGGAPTTADVLAAATRPPVAAAQIDPNQPALLQDRVEDVRFPNYAGKLGWEAVGTRTDEIGGRDTKTVFYRNDGRRVAYTIVAGEQLPWPTDAARTEAEGIELRVFEADDRTTVTWRRNGHTCVLSSADVPREELVELATWQGQGAVDF